MGLHKFYWVKHKRKNPYYEVCQIILFSVLVSSRKLFSARGKGNERIGEEPGIKQGERPASINRYFEHLNHHFYQADQYHVVSS
jgi:hypothetical protein